MTGLIGFRWTHGNVWSREVLIVRGLTTFFLKKNSFATGHSILGDKLVSQSLIFLDFVDPCITISW